MATTQRSRSKSSTKGKGASKGRSPAKGRGASRAPSGPSLGDGLRRVFDGHGHDVAGVVLIAVGLVAAMGIWFDGAGAAGRALDAGARGLLGLAGVIVPVLAVAGGVLLMRGPVDDDGVEDDDAAHTTRLRAAIGGLLLLVSVVGVLHLTGGQPDVGDGVDALGSAGGALGSVVAGPLDGLLGVWAAGLALAAVGVIGLVIITDRSLRHVAQRTADGVRPAGSVVRRGWRALFTLGEHDGLDDPADDDVEPPAFVNAAAPVDAPPEPEPDPVPEVRLPVAEPAVEVPAPELAADDDDAEPTQLEIALPPSAKGSSWKLPPRKLLERGAAAEVDQVAVEERGRVLERALAEHGVETRLVGMVVGPTVTRYELELGPGVKVARVTSLHKDIAYAMASPDVRILAPIPGRQAIGVEVPNENRQVVAVGDILASEEARRASHPLEVAIGRDINGRSILANLATMPHVLIAGQTGAGKSSCINSLITSILMRSTPDDVRMVLVDPKRVELGQYNGLPHLLTQVVTNPKKAANALAWVVKEMERRYDLLSEVGFRDIGGYNAAFDRGDLATEPTDGVVYERLPFILVVVDELADLMMVAARDVEESICRIAQMARAVGIHLVIATQRPSVNVITGVIKANVPARLAFAVSSLADSRVILDQPGAERLVGKGDMLLLGPSSSVAQRIQGCWVSEAEVHGVVANWRRQAPELAYDDETVQGTDEGSSGSPGAGSAGGGSGDDDDDDLLVQARELVVRSQLGSTSMLQRKLRVGFARAGRIMDLLEERGVVGPSEGSKARAVLMTVEELEAGATSPTGGDAFDPAAEADGAPAADDDAD